jgi:3-hydroxy-9,10-secoandrosta-1,3,5(10)-triene-9,17-dione monooxygenase
MGTSLSAQTIEITPPEPDLTAERLVERARALRPALRSRQEQTERLTHPPQASHDDFLAAGFYRMVQPRRFGGYEFTLRTFAEVILEIARGCPSTGWNLCLASGHSVTLATHFSDQAQRELFGPDGDFRAPLPVAPTGMCTRSGDGWIVEGRWDYASGITASTHFLAGTLVDDGNGGPPTPGIVCVPDGWEMLDNWGEQLGMRGSGSNSVVVAQVWVPDHYVARVDVRAPDLTAGTPGGRLHGNPLYAGQTMSFFNAELVPIIVGCAWAALDEYERILTTKQTQIPPFKPRRDVGEHQRTFGIAWALTDAAQRILLGLDGGAPFSPLDDQRLSVTMRQAGQMASQAVDLVAAAAGSSALADGQRMQRYLRDVATYKTHVNAQHGSFATLLGATLLGAEAAA